MHGRRARVPRTGAAHNRRAPAPRDPVSLPPFLSPSLPLFLARPPPLFPPAHIRTSLCMFLAAGEESTRLFCALKDLRTLLRMLASMANVFVDSFEQSLASASALVGKVLDLADYIRVHSLHRRGAQFCKLYGRAGPAGPSAYTRLTGPRVCFGGVAVDQDNGGPGRAERVHAVDGAVRCERGRASRARRARRPAGAPDRRRGRRLCPLVQRGPQSTQRRRVRRPSVS